MKKIIGIIICLILLMVCFLPYIEAIKIRTKNVTEKDMLLKTVDEPDIEWIKFYGNPDTSDTVCDIKETSYGGYILAGTQVQTTGYFEGWLFKTDAVGTVEWEKNFNMGQSGIILLGCMFEKEVIEVSDGYVVGGTIQQTESDDPYTLFHCILLIKVDLTGNLVWEQKYGNLTEETKLIGLCGTNDGGFVILGVIVGNDDFVVIKTDDAGNIEWKQVLNSREIFNDDIYLNGIKTTYDDGFIIHAHLMDTTATCLLKLSDFGYEEWHRIYYHNNGENVYQDVIQTKDGGYLCSLGYGGIIKVDSTGYEEWRRTYDGGGEIRSIAEVNDNGYILTGDIYPRYYQEHDIWILRIDNKGNTLWSKNLGEYEDEDEGVCVRQTSDGGFVIAAQTYYPKKNQDPCQVWIIKLKPESSSGYKPSRPSGPSYGEPGVKYEFSTRIHHPNELPVYFGWDWGDGSEIEWTYDIYESGETCTMSHVWYEEGVFKIRVIAMDINGLESEWSDYHSISLPRNKINQNNLFLRIIQRFAILQKILPQ